jgi:predicted HNH restriction endonuclease
VVHHKSYDQAVLLGNNDAELVSLCFECHTFIEFEGDRKLTLQEANNRLHAG